MSDSQETPGLNKVINALWKQPTSSWPPPDSENQGESLFDQYFMVRKMITPHIIRVVCALLTILCAIAAAFGLFRMISGGYVGFQQGLLLLVASLVSMVVIRILTEFTIVIFNIHDHTAALVEQGKAGQRGGSPAQEAAE